MLEILAPLESQRDIHQAPRGSLPAPKFIETSLGLSGPGDCTY
jgi:hypothetical protein